MQRLEQMLSHYSWSRKRTFASYPPEEQMANIELGLSWYGPDAKAIAELLDGLCRIPEGREWLKTNPVFLDGVKAACVSAKSGTDDSRRAAWLALEAKLSEMDMGVTNAPAQ